MRTMAAVGHRHRRAQRTRHRRARWTVGLRLVAPLLAGAVFGHVTGSTSPANAAVLTIETVRDIPANYLVLYQRAGPTCKGLRWQLLAAVGRVESDHGRVRAPGVTSGQNPSGAAGPMQFLAATWKQYGTTNITDRYNPANAIAAAARFLCAIGAGSNEAHAASSYYAGPYATGKGRAQGDAYAALVEAQADAYAGGQTGPGGGLSTTPHPSTASDGPPPAHVHRHRGAPQK